MKNNFSIVIIGAGEIGCAIKSVLKRRGTAIFLFDKNPAKMPEQKSLAEIIPETDFLFFCIPSWVLNTAIKDVLLYLNPKTVVISLSKGIEEKTHQTSDEILARALPKNQRFALLHGPMIAEEITKGMAGVGVVATARKETFELLNELFRNSNLILEHSEEVHSVALAGVLKNIYSIALGIADGLNWSGNQKGWLVSLAINEMAKILEILGGKKEIAYGAAGLGDLIATGYSPHSRNRKVGEEVAKTGKCCLESEGQISLQSLLELLGERKNIFPLLIALENILMSHQNAKEVFERIKK